MAIRATGLILLLAAGLALAACQPAQQIASKPVKASLRKTVPAEQMLGRTSVVVRTYKKEADGSTSEVTGAKCTLRSRELAAQVTTPQIVNYPVFLQAARFANRGKPGNMVVTCKVAGMTGTKTIAAFAGVPSKSNSSTSFVNGQAVTTSSYGLHGKQLATSQPWGYGGLIRVDLQ